MDNNLKKIKIFDRNFAHATYSTDHQISKYIVWDRSGNVSDDEIVFYTDTFLNIQNNNIKNKYAWLMEPPSISPHIYKIIKTNYKNFEKVLTYDKDLLDIGKNFEFYPHSGCWIAPEDQKIYEKNKLISTIVSNKKSTDGHKLRHLIVDKFKDDIDVYGRGYNPVKYKKTALQDYMFSITVENTKKDYYFTEKIIDCFMSGTIPIYYGCPSIGDFFDINGIIVFNDLDELENIIYNLDENTYINKYKSVVSNFKKAKEFLIAEDWIFKNIIKNYE